MMRLLFCSIIYRRIQLVITTREDPPIPLARLRARPNGRTARRRLAFHAGLQLAEVAKPAPEGNGALIRVHATPVNFGDLIARNFKNVTPCKFNMPIFFWLPARMAFGWRKPKNNVLGSEFAGEVAAVGAQVTRFKPANMTFEEAAAAIELSSDQQWTQRALNDLQQSEDSGTKIRTFERSPRE
jgi:Alcohol dehydrogenase GroES-like domain